MSLAFYSKKGWRGGWRVEGAQLPPRSPGPHLQSPSPCPSIMLAWQTQLSAFSRAVPNQGEGTGNNYGTLLTSLTFLKKIFIYSIFWLCWVFVAECGLFLVGERRGSSPGFSGLASLVVETKS